VIEEDCVVGIFTQQLLCLRNILRDVNEVTLESYCKPLVPAAVVVQEEHANGMTLDGSFV